MVRVPQSMAPIVLGLTFKKMGAKKNVCTIPTISTASSLVDYGDFEQMVSDVGCDSLTDDRPDYLYLSE